VLVTITKPYFRIIDPQSLLEEDYSFISLEDDPDFEVSEEVLKEFIGLVKKFLLNGKTAHPDRPAQIHSLDSLLVHFVPSFCRVQYQKSRFDPQPLGLSSRKAIDNSQVCGYFSGQKKVF
jgi:hypothetical protein